MESRPKSCCNAIIDSNDSTAVGTTNGSCDRDHDRDHDHEDGSSSSSSSCDDDDDEEDRSSVDSKLEETNKFQLAESSVGSRDRSGNMASCDQNGEEMVAEVRRQRRAGSVFFEQNQAQPLPQFDSSAIQLGILLGCGEFGAVYEIHSLLEDHKRKPKTTGCGCNHIGEPDHLSSSTAVTITIDLPSEDQELTTTTTNISDRNLEEDGDEEDDIISALDEFDEDGEVEYHREYMVSHVYRCGQSRYALKRLRHNLNHDRMLAVADMSCEAEIMASLSHPNIVKIRGIMGVPGQESNTFGLILDRLNETLREKIDEWRLRKKESKGTILQRLQRQKSQEWNQLLLERLLATYDIARAMKYLHNKRILFRDLKPDNVGVNLRGDFLIFDFGLSKELKKIDLREAPDGFEATGLTGSRRYMAPEVANCKLYGFSADVYSFAILLWECIFLKIPFKNLNFDEHFDQVVLQGKRPVSIGRKAFPALNEALEDCWSPDPYARPSFEVICNKLLATITRLRDIDGVEGTTQNDLEDRTKELVAKSHASRDESVKECC